MTGTKPSTPHERALVFTTGACPAGTLPAVTVDDVAERPPPLADVITQ